MEIILEFAISEFEKYKRLLCKSLKKTKEFERIENSKLNTFIKEEIDQYIVQKIKEKKEKKEKINEILKKYKKTNSDDAYCIAWKKSDFWIWGKSQRAILYGVYDILEKWGIRWFFPGKLFEQLPNQTDISDEEILLEIPDFETRGIIIGGSLKNARAWLDFAAKQRMNWIGLRTEKLFYRLHPEIMQRGFKAEIIQRNLGYYFCTANKNEFKASRKNLHQYISIIPESQNIINLWPNHNHFPRCNCANDRNLHCSELMLYRLNLLANDPKIKKNKKLSYLAIGSSWPIPKKVHPNPKISLDLAPVHRCFSHGLDEEICECNKNYIVKEINLYLKWFNTESIRYVAPWFTLRIFSWTKFKFLGNDPETKKPRIPYFPRVIQSDLRFLKSKKISKIIIPVDNLDENYFKVFTQPMITHIGKYLWNYKISSQQLLHDFCQQYFRVDEERWFFDETERIDPRDLSHTQYVGYLSLAKNRAEKLKNYLEHNKKIPVKFKNRINRMINEQALKTKFKGSYWFIKLTQTFYVLWLKYVKLRN